MKIQAQPNKDSVAIFWFRRDLRLEDNAGLYNALKNTKNVLPLFIFDKDILKKLPTTDARVCFIYDTIQSLKLKLQSLNSDLLVEYGTPLEVFKSLIKRFEIKTIFANHDYEMTAIERDVKIQKWADNVNIEFKTFKDQVIFEKNEILTDQRKPYTVYTSYKNKWQKNVSEFYLKPYPTQKYFHYFYKIKTSFHLPSLESMGFNKNFDSKIQFPERKIDISILKNYAEDRNNPSLDATSHMGIHLRFGTLSIRKAAQVGYKYSVKWLEELIWRDFFMQILWHYPHVQNQSFNKKYDHIDWRDDLTDIELWKQGLTGYPMVDAGMRELKNTGFMHNRVRMVTASFLTKHLLVHWSIGERYFAEKLLDYDLAANNGNWQWASGSGCDAAPFFRVFNPETQMQKFDPQMHYIKKWIPEYGTLKYPAPMVEHKFARERALKAYKKGISY